MHNYLNFDKQGIYVTSVTTSNFVPKGSVMLPDGFTIKEGCNLYRPDGKTLKSRPLGPKLEKVTNTLWQAHNVLEGTRFEVMDIISGESIYGDFVEKFEAGTLDIEFEEAGTFEVFLSSPLPYTQTKTVIIVGENNEP